MNPNALLLFAAGLVGTASSFAQGTPLGSKPEPLPKPVGRWGFDAIEPNGGLKSSMGGASGKVSGGKIVDGRIGKALAFAHTGTVASVPVGLKRRNAKAITVALWIYPEGLETPEYGPIFECGQNRGLMFRTMNDRWFSLNYAGIWHLKAPNSPKAPVEKRRWSYLTMTYDGKVGRFYIDGKLAEPECVAPFTPQFTDDAVLGRLAYGQIDDVEIGKEDRMVQFVGRMDDLQVFDKALTREQVKVLFAEAKNAKPPSGGGLGLLP